VSSGESKIIFDMDISIIGRKFARLKINIKKIISQGKESSRYIKL